MIQYRRICFKQFTLAGRFPAGVGLSSSTNKKVIVYRFDRESIAGFVSPQAWLTAGGVEVLTPAGAIATVPFGEIKVVCFVKEFDGEGWGTERRLFASRPKTEGLWVRALFRDNDFLEGILPNELLQLDAYGYLLAPPDASSNNQRVFVPRAALKEMKVVGVVGAPRRPAKGKPEGRAQIGLFEEAPN